MKKACSLISPFTNNSSSAKVGRTIVKSLDAINANFTTVDISDRFNNIAKYHERKLLKILSNTSEDIPRGNVVFNSNLEVMDNYSFPNKFIPYLSIKTNSIPRRYVDMLYAKERIMAYNHFTKNILIDSGVKEDAIKIVPPSINSKIYTNNIPFHIFGKRNFAFLSVIDSCEDNGWIDTIGSFYDSFSDSNDVCFVLKVNNSIYSKYYQLEIARAIDHEKKKYNKNLPPIILISESLTDEEIASLYSECNCYVKISGVNSGLSFIEAFASGLVCVGPESGGCREILNRDIGFMINKRCEKRISNNTLFNGITYNVYDDEHLSEVMLWIFNNFSKLKEKTVKERKIVLSKFDCNVVSQTFLKSLG